MCFQKTSRACRTSGSRELCQGRVQDKRTARLQASGVSTIYESLSGTERRARCRPTNALEGAGGKAHAIWLSAIDGDAVAGRNGGQSQARVPAVPGGRLGDEDSATTADPLEWRGN